MIKNYFTIAWRNIARYKVYSVINILGLSLGLCACIVIYLIANYEFSFDRFTPGYERIYRITGEFKRSNGQKEFLNSIVPEMAGVENAISGFEEKAGIHFYYGKITVPETGGEFDSRNDVVVTWPEYFRIFKYAWLAGNETSALNKPYQVVLSESKARIYFGNIEPGKLIGKTLIYNDSLVLSVSGVVRDWDNNSDLRYTDFISISTVSNNFLKKTIRTNDWSGLEPHRSMVFVKLDKHITKAQINAQLKAYIKKNIRPASHGSLTSMELQPLANMHFTDEYYRGDDGDNFRKAHLPTLYALIGIALFILIIAAANFINLATAQSLQRSREIGIRKVLGSTRISLVLQFLTETFVLTFFAACIAVLFIKPFMGIFRSFIPTGVEFEPSLKTVIFLALITIVTSLFAGFYPAKILSGFLPAISLRGPIARKHSGKSGVRKSLIVFQFTISLIFIISAIAISKQIGFMHSKEKGFKSDAIVTIENWGDKGAQMKLLMEKIKKIPGAGEAIIQGTPPMGFAENSAIFKYKGVLEVDLNFLMKLGDENFIPFYRMKLVAGRNIIQGDSLRELVINEACSKAIGFTNPAEAIGKLLYSSDNKPFPIVGVVADFHTGSFHEVIKPTLIGHMPQWETSIAINLATNGKQVKDVKSIISQIEQQWKEVFPDQEFNYSFLDEYIALLFEKDLQSARLVNAAMLITIFISCMGLFGLAMFTAERRIKEIGIRKVLGASVVNITAMLSKDFAILVLIAMLIASPIAWFFMDTWLLDFAYRTELSWWIFAIAGMAAILIAIVTVSFQAIKAALSNPVKTLKSE